MAINNRQVVKAPKVTSINISITKPIIRRIRQKLYAKFLQPRSNTEDNQRRELILNILLLGTMGLALFALISAFIVSVSNSMDYDGVPVVSLAIFCFFLLILLAISRKGYYHLAAVIFVAVLFMVPTYPIIVWGILLPQGILMYSLVIIMAGVLVSSRFAFYTTLLITISLLVIKYLEDKNLIDFNLKWMQQTGGYNDVVMYGFTFILVAVVAWLSNRETEISLARARKSEKDLIMERNSLEVKIKERTKLLENAQTEKLLEINRFAEFGRVSSTLLHELANPLTSMSLNVEQLESRQQAELVKQVRKSIKFMEKYLNNARRQLRSTSDIRTFDAAEEIKEVVSFIKPKAAQERIKVVLELVKGVTLLGDSIRFNQIIANLMVNAIDASKENTATERYITISMNVAELYIQINVSDQGSGLSVEQKSRIFDPFYTTKSFERGTGLGLTITKRAVEEDFKGTITVTSDKRIGTCFNVMLPLP